MSNVGAPKGNQNAAKGRRFEQALWREMLARDVKDGDGETIRRVAAVMIDNALGGDLAACKEIRDTLDGKPTQTLAGDPENPFVIGNVERNIIDPKNTDS